MTHGVKTAWLDVKAFSDEELGMLAVAVNRFGSGQHAMATKANLHFFSKGYAKECLEKSMAPSAETNGATLTDKGKEVAEGILAKM